MSSEDLAEPLSQGKPDKQNESQLDELDEEVQGAAAAPAGRSVRGISASQPSPPGGAARRRAATPPDAAAAAWPACLAAPGERAASPGLVAAGPPDAADEASATRSDGQLSVGERPTPSELSLGQLSVGEEASVERCGGEEGEVAPAPCLCGVCAARCSLDPTPAAAAAAGEDPQLERLCRHTVEMMRLDGVSEEEKRRLVRQLKVMVPASPREPPPPAEPFPFQRLPAEIQLLVFSFLSPRELCTSVLPVCAEWNALGRDPVLWRHLAFGADDVVPTRTVVSILSHSHLLRSLRLEARRHADQIIFQAADTCKQLREITAKFCDGLSSVLLEVLVKHCPLIERANFEGSRFEDPGCMAAITGLRHLRTLNISHCLRLEDAELRAVVRACPLLEELNVDGVGYLTDAAVLDLVALNGERLTSLVLDGENLTDAGFSAIGRCANLQTLCVSFADGMTDASLPSLGRLRALDRLKIRRGNQLGAAALARLFERGNLARLRHLDLSECSNVSDETVGALTAHCPRLTFLALSWCWDITDAGLEWIVWRLRFLRVLDLIGVVRITGRCFRHIPERLPELRYLNLEQCSDVQDLVVERVVRRRPQLHALDYYGDRVIPRPAEMETWADEVDGDPRQIQLPITINLLVLKDGGEAPPADAAT